MRQDVRAEGDQDDDGDDVTHWPERMGGRTATLRRRRRDSQKVKIAMRGSRINLGGHYNDGDSAENRLRI